MQKILICLFVFLSSISFGATFQNSERDFAIRNPENTRNIKGNIAVIGNTVLCPKDRGGACTESANGQSNSDANLKYVNLYGATGTYPTSSSARLNIPNSATVVWAGVYAQGYLKSKTTINTATNAMNGPIGIRTVAGNYSLLPDIVNFRRNTSYGHTYGSYYPIPNIIGLKGSQINGDVIVSNIRAEEGTDNSGLGNSGAWSLIIIYEDASETLKNISVFDGFKEISSSRPNVNINISGFLTPSSGTVNSSLSFFVGEGDKYIVGDNLFVNNVRVTSTLNNNVMDSSIVGVPNRNPFLTNNQGIDIQNHDISYIINNGAASATIRLTSTQDTYFPIMVAFTTELYEPRVCYVRELLNEHGNATVKNVINGDTITVRTWFTNLPQPDQFVEDAKKVQIILEHDLNTLQYVSDSTNIKNIGQTNYVSTTDRPNDDLNTYNSTSNESYWNLGQGATSSDGGLFRVNDSDDENLKAFVDYKAKINVPTIGSGSITIGGQYRISYEDSTSGIRFGDGSPISMGSCRALAEDIWYSNPSGLFNMVNENFSNTSTRNYESGNHSQNTLYTQIADKEFTVKLLSLDSSNKESLINTSANVTIDLIETPDIYNEETCKNAGSIYNFGNFTLNNEKLKAITIKYPNAKKSVSFKIINLQNGIVSCSRDSNGFTIRPAQFKIEDIAPRLIGGKNENVKLHALSYTGNTTSSYNQTMANILTTNIELNKPRGCTKDYVAGEFNKAGSNFINGKSNTTMIYDNIGNLSVTFLDSNWTAQDTGNNACIRNSSSNAHTCGRVGCNIEMQEDFMFYPQTFNTTIELKDFNNGNFTYLSELNQMYSMIDIDITAILYNNKTATNYHTNCWANDVTYKVKLDDNLTDWSYETGENATDRVLFHTINAAKANITSNSSVSPISVITQSSNFQSGLARDLIIGLNFKRDKNIKQVPFTVNAQNDLELLDMTDTDGTSATNASAKTGDAKFYYGRVSSVDYVGSSPIAATLRYEAYCDKCDTTTYDALTSTNKNTNDPRWYLNKEHDDVNGGNVTSLQQLTVGGGIGINPNSSVAGGIAAGKENVVLTHANPPHFDYIEIYTQDWLIYDKDDKYANKNKFHVEFFSPGGGWAGVGQVRRDTDTNKTGRVINTSTSHRTSKALDW